MAVQDDSKKASNSNDAVVKIKNWREARLCRNMLIGRDFYFASIEPSNLVQYGNAINSSIKNKIHDSKNREEFIKNMQRACVDEIIPLSTFDWIKDNARACYWIWYQVRAATVSQLSAYQYSANKIKVPSYVQDSQVNASLPPMLSLYLQFNLTTLPASHQERFDAIMDFFDLWSASDVEKNKYLFDMKLQWSAIFNEHDPFYWLSEVDNGQCLWAWEYASPKIHSYYIKPLSPKDYYHATYALFDTWVIHPDTKKIFLMKMSKAWGQKKYRDGLLHKVPLNTYLDTEVKMKLDALAEGEGKKINEMITTLINEAFERK